MIPKREHAEDRRPQLRDKVARSLRNGDRVLHPSRVVVRQKRGFEFRFGDGRNGLGARRLEAG